MENSGCSIHRCWHNFHNYVESSSAVSHSTKLGLGITTETFGGGHYCRGWQTAWTKRLTLRSWNKSRCQRNAAIRPIGACILWDYIEWHASCDSLSHLNSPRISGPTLSWNPGPEPHSP